MSVDTLEFRKTLRQWACGVTVVTTAVGERRAGITASSFTSVTLEPPTILVCLTKSSPTTQLINEAQVFGVSILADHQISVSNQFAGYVTLPEGEDRFYQIPMLIGNTGVPLLSEAVAWLECKLRSIYDGGTHEILVGEVLATTQNAERAPLIYQNQAYRTVSEPIAENPSTQRDEAKGTRAAQP